MGGLGKYCPKEWRTANDLIVQIVSSNILLSLGSYRWSPTASVVCSRITTLILILTLTPTLALTLRLSCVVVAITVLQSSYSLSLSVTIPNSYFYYVFMVVGCCYLYS